MPELLSPAGSYDSLCAAVDAGADAVYIGGRLFSARAYADNPDTRGLIEGIEYCHLRGKKIYLTVNTLLKEEELYGILPDFLMPFYENGIDALIVQDLGAVKYLKEIFPDIPLHASTQMSVTTPEGALLLARHGISRVVPARELSLCEVSDITNSGIEVETFIHGAMCYCYSGRCLLSAMIGGRSGNRGRCAQPCRMPFCMEGKSKKSLNADETYLLSMKDMCTLDILPDLIDAGIASFKIEGRMKQPQYTAGVTAVYRKYIDLYLQGGREEYQVDEKDRQILLDLFDRRGFSEGYYNKYNGSDMIAWHRPREESPKEAQLRSERNQHLLKEKSKVKINGDLRIYPETPVILELWPEGEEKGGPFSVKIYGEVPQKARTSAASVSEVNRQMLKTGDTDFVFEHLNTELAGGLFLPVSILNKLRREGLEKLKEQILKARGKRTQPQRYGRGIKDLKSEPGRHAEVKTYSDTAGFVSLAILFTQFFQLDSFFYWLKNSGSINITDTVYLDSALLGFGKSLKAACRELSGDIDKLHGYGIHCLFAVPGVLRRDTRTVFQDSDVCRLMNRMDGFLIQSVDWLEFLKPFCSFYKTDERTAEIVADDCLYTFNRESRLLLQNEGVTRFTLPAELKERELAELGCKDAEMIVYGYQPLMQSAQCVKKNTSGCDHLQEVCRIKDRRNVDFPVLSRCLFCTNTVYNSVPLRLDGCRDGIIRLAPSRLRLSFTIESYETTGDIIGEYTELFARKEAGEISEVIRDPGKISYGNAGTRGLFKRGVE